MIYKKSSYVRTFFCSIEVILHMPRFYHSTFTYNQSDFMALASEKTALFSCENQKSFLPVPGIEPRLPG